MGIEERISRLAGAQATKNERELLHCSMDLRQMTKTAIERYGLKQYKIAEALGISKQQMSTYLSGAKNLTYEKACKLAWILTGITE